MRRRSSLPVTFLVPTLAILLVLSMVPTLYAIVIALQNRELSTPGYDPQGIDGVFGPNTRTALTTFQSDFGLPKPPNAKHVGDIGAATVGAIAAQLDSLGVSYLRP